VFIVVPKARVFPQVRKLPTTEWAKATIHVNRYINTHAHSPICTHPHTRRGRLHCKQVDMADKSTMLWCCLLKPPYHKMASPFPPHSIPFSLSSALSLSLWHYSTYMWLISAWETARNLLETKTQHK